jgi:4'-phosphopantetheinyl transferase EntD
VQLPINLTLSESVNAAPLIASLFAEGAVAYQTWDTHAADTLLGAEREAVIGAVAKRIHEFAGGRACARAALSQLGYDAVALPVGTDRAPRWPLGVAGSITHTAGFCAAVVARSAQIRSLGLDAEPAASVKPHLWRRICTAEELALLESQDAPSALGTATLMFSAKEAFYKCQHALTAQWLDFSDVRVSLEPDDHFKIWPTQSLLIAEQCPGPWRGRYLRERGLVVTGVCIV